MKTGAERLKQKAQLLASRAEGNDGAGADKRGRGGAGLSALEEFTELAPVSASLCATWRYGARVSLLGLRAANGFINSIGLEMYIKLLNGEIDRIKGPRRRSELPEPKMDLLVQAFIPEDYVGDDMERLNFYKKPA